jgi:putative sterol carrier protein
LATPQTARDFFATLPERVPPDKAAELDNSYAFDIADAGQWTVEVGDEGVKVSEGLGEADATFSTSEDVFMRIVNGDQNPTTAVMMGKMKVKGDISAAMKLSKLF